MNSDYLDLHKYSLSTKMERLIGVFMESRVCIMLTISFSRLIISFYKIGDARDINVMGCSGQMHKGRKYSP